MNQKYHVKASVDKGYGETYNSQMREKPEQKKQNFFEALRKPQETLSEDRVRLPVFLGARPGVYLAVIYSAVLLAILFFILIFPGLTSPGSVVEFKTEPSGAALRVDGVYLGSSPSGIFVPKGPHSLEVVLPGFTAKRIDCEIPGRLFASAFFPRTFPLEVELASPDPDAVLAAAAADYAAWTFGGEPTLSWQVPLSLSEGAYRIAGRGNPRSTEELLEASARFAVTRAAFRDLVRAKFLSANNGLSPSPAGLVPPAWDIIGFLSKTPGAAAWLKDTLPADSSAILAASPWYKKQTAATGGGAFAGAVAGTARGLAGAEPPAARLNLGGLSYTGIPGGYLGNRRIAAFMICDTEVSAGAFETFLAARPEWAADQKEALIEKGLATSNYLLDEKPAGLFNGGLAGVSWFAAQAYCAWLSERLPPSMENYELRLPAEAEWEYAALHNQGLFPVGLWEWCEDPYVQLPFIPASPEAIAAIGSPERSLRGWPDPAGPRTRASLPPDSCSSFVSFRPVVALKNKN